MRRFFPTLILLSLFLAACGPDGPSSLPATQTASATATVLPSASPLPSLTATATLTQIEASPTATIGPTATPLPAIRNTPATLMLHKSNDAFDSVEFLRQFVAILKANEIQVITYEDLSENPDLSATNRGRLVIITIDDIYLQYESVASVRAMIDILLEAGYPAVLGIVTEGENQNPAVVERLRYLSGLGWEIAAHTDQHANLGVMEQSAPRYIFTEISICQDKIEAAVGVRPITLILPEGQMVNDVTQIRRAGIVWIVGINGGTTYDATRSVHYVGREGPDGTPEFTFEIMLRRFYP